ncbi:hypothetical protein Tco_0237268 [Tanacetum coccineum]
MASSPNIDSLLDEFIGELIIILPRIVNREHEEYISLLERLLYDNSSPRPPKDFHAIPNTIIESLPTFPILVEDSDSLREEIDIFPSPDDSNTTGLLIVPDFEASRAHGFFLHSLELHILSFILGIQYPNLID